METRKRAIQSHLIPLNLPTTLLNEATFIALECNKKFTRLTKVCAAIGLILASTNRGLPTSTKQVADQLNIKYSILSKHFSRMKLAPVPTKCKKIQKLEEILNKVDADPEVREKAYALIESKTCKTPLKAVEKAITGCNGLSLAIPETGLFLAKHNKNQLFQTNIELRIQNLILRKPVAYDTLPCLSTLDFEKRILAKALGISYNNYIE